VDQSNPVAMVATTTLVKALRSFFKPFSSACRDLDYPVARLLTYPNPRSLKGGKITHDTANCALQVAAKMAALDDSLDTGDAAAAERGRYKNRYMKLVDQNQSSHVIPFAGFRNMIGSSFDPQRLPPLARGGRISPLITLHATRPISA